MMMRRVFVLILFLSLNFFSHPAAAAVPDELLRQVRVVEDRVKKIEANQQEILDQQKKILTELDNLRIWIARR